MLLTRAYLREIGLHLGLVLGGATLLLGLGAAIRASSISQGAPIWFPLVLTPLIVVNALPYLMPVALMVAVLLTYGRMAGDLEATAMRAAGSGPWRLLMPAIVAGALMAVISYPLSASWLPQLYTFQRELSYRLRFAVLENLHPGASELHVQGLHLLWKEREADGAFRDVTLFWRETDRILAYAGDPGSESTDLGGAVHMRADRARMDLEDKQLVFRFKGMRSLREAGDGDGWTARSEAASLRLDLDSVASRPKEDRKSDDFTSAEIQRWLNSGKMRNPERQHRFTYTFWRRVATALSSLPIALLGAMLGWRLRRGGFLVAFTASFGALMLVYYPLYYLGNNLVNRGGVDPRLCAWFPILGLGAVLLLLARRAVRT